MDRGKAARAALMLARPKRALGGALPYSTGPAPTMPSTPSMLGGPFKVRGGLPGQRGGGGDGNMLIGIPGINDGGGGEGAGGNGSGNSAAGSNAAAGTGAAASGDSGTGSAGDGDGQKRGGRIRRADGGPVDEPPPENGLYSQAARIVAALPQAKASPQQFKATLLKQGVKPDEMKWSGYDEKLGSKPVVTKDEVAQHFQRSLPNVQETELRDEQPPNWDRKKEYQASKYSSYQLPGAENYREVLLHLPKTSSEEEAQLKQAHATALQRRRDAASAKVKLAAEHNQARSPESQRAYAQALIEHEEASDGLRDAEQKMWEARDRGTYKSSHWDQSNVLAHLRMSDRTGPSGEKILHLEEMQSDWAQEGRQKGFRDNYVNKLTPEEDDELTRLWNLSPRERDTARYEELRAKARDATVKSMGLPSAPYVDSTAKWTDLGLKRALQEAAKGGYDKLVITPGEEQAARYDLSKQISRLTAQKDRDGTFHLEALPHGKQNVAGEWLPAGTKVAPEALAAHVGKDMAQRILDDAEQHRQLAPVSGKNFDKEYSGLDLKVGGEGMKGYYDKILPTALQKLAKKHDPSAEVKLHGHAMTSTRAQEGASGSDVLNEMGMPEHEQDAYWRGLSSQERDEHFANYRDKKIHTKLHSLDITPKMRASILRGHAAYATGGSVPPSDNAIVQQALQVVPDDHPVVQQAQQILKTQIPQRTTRVPREREYPISHIIARGEPLAPRDPHPTDEALATARADDRVGGDIVNKRLATIVPERERVAGGTYTPGAPGGGRWADATVPSGDVDVKGHDPFPLDPDQYVSKPSSQKLVDQPGKGFKTTDAELDHLWKQSVEESSQAAKNAVGKHGVRPTFSARDWHDAMSLPLRDHLWYELSGEKMAENLPDLTAKQHMKFLDIIGATSARAKPDENLERSLGVLSQHMRGVPIDVDLTIPSTVRQALARDSDKTSALPGNKTGHFSDTLALAGGLPTRFPISVNDVWVGKMFGVPDDVMSSNQSLHEPMAKYFNKLRDVYNERMDPPFTYQSWNFQAPAWVHLRNMESGAQQGDAYHQVWEKTVNKLKDAGVPGISGDRISKEALMDPRFADALRRTTKPFRDAPKATIEFGTTQTPIGKRAHELYHQAIERDDELSQNEYLKGLTTAMYQSARGKNHPWDALKKAVTGNVTQKSDITRIAAPTSDAPLDIGGTFEGAVSPNIRIPLRDMTDDHIAAFNAVAGKHLRQDAMAVSTLHGAEQGSEPREGHIRGHSIFVPTTEQISPQDLRAFAKEMGDQGHSMSYARYPNGYHFDVLPSFTDDGIKGVTETQLDDAYGKTLRPNYGTAMVLPHDFKSVYTEASEYDKIRKDLLKGFKDDFVQQAVAAGASKRSALAAAAAETPPQDLPRGGKKAWDVYRARHDHLAAAEKGFKELAQRVTDAHAKFIGKAEKRFQKPIAPRDPDAPPFKRGGSVYDRAKHVVPTAGRYANGGAIDHDPSDAQKTAGNYAKRKSSFQGIPISIENALGSVRHGIDRNGKAWSCKLPADYGYIRGTEGADGDHVDAYIGPNLHSELVVLVNQCHLGGGFDEHKVLLGFKSEKEAIDCYCKAFSDGKGADRIKSVEVMSVPAFKNWLKSGRTTRPANARSIVDKALQLTAR